MTFPHAPTPTLIGQAPTRLPGGEQRMRLMRLAVRGSKVYRDGECPVAERISRSLVMALTDLAIAESRVQRAENSLAAALVRIDELKRQIQIDRFDEPTVTREAPQLANERTTARRSAVRSTP